MSPAIFSTLPLRQQMQQVKTNLRFVGGLGKIGVSRYLDPVRKAFQTGVFSVRDENGSFRTL